MIAHPSPNPWTLATALEIRRGDVVALVGGGGKTSTLFRLGRELAAGGWQVLLTTTTHIGRLESALAPHHLVVHAADPAGDHPPAAGGWSPLLVTAPPTENGSKWGGVPPDWIARWQADAVLVEADGAKGHPFKAPAPHEPVVPACTTLLVPVVGVDAVGQTVEEASHRPACVSAITGLAGADRLTPEAMATVLGHPSGGLKGIPAAARVSVLINKVQSRSDLAAAREIARLLLRPGTGVRSVVLAAVAADAPVLEVHRRVAAVVLAAGQSVRMGGEVPKQLLLWGGKPLVRQVVDVVAGLPLDPLLVVTGHQAGAVAESLSGTRAELVHNPAYAAGEMISSLQAAVRTLSVEVSGCLVVLCDQPWLDAAVVRAVLEGYAAGPHGLVAPTFGGRRGHPVLIDGRHWAELLAMGPGLSPRDLIGRHLDDLLLRPVETESILQDLDTWDDYQQALTGR